MCFSASASFGAGAALTLIGFASARKVYDRSQLPLALFPFIFAVQQFAEGFVWLSLSNPNYLEWQGIPIYSFLTFSHIIWPVWIPFSILVLEKDMKRKKVLKFLFAAGIILSLYHVYCLMYLPVKVRIESHHIHYLVAHPVWLLMPANILYALSAVFPPFVSSIRKIWWLGLFIVVSYVAAYLMYKVYVISVWCYFAIMLSILVYFILSGFQKIASRQQLKYGFRMFR